MTTADTPPKRPPGHRVHTTTWSAYGPQLPAAEVLAFLDRVDDCVGTSDPIGSESDSRTPDSSTGRQTTG